MADEPRLFELDPVQRRERLKRKRKLLPVWTEHKARLIARYLYYFVLVTRHGTYIDGFAGPQSADSLKSWAAELVLANRPPLLKHFHLVDLARSARQKLDALKERHVDRDVEIYCPRDINEVIDAILTPNNIKPKEATFCLLDQRSFECTWETVTKIARFPKEDYKIEQFYFLASGWLGRAIAATHKEESLQLINAWWGNSGWDSLRGMNAWDLAELVCDRFEKELGYKWVEPWPIYQSGESDRLMYHMIHASDHDDAPKLMARAYETVRKPKESLPQLVLELGLPPLDEEGSDSRRRRRARGRRP